MVDSRVSSELTAEETVGLIEGWLRTTPRLSFKQVRADARNLNITVSPRQYGEAKRRLGITAAPPRPVQPRNTHARGADMDTPVVTKTPLMSFLVEFLRNKPDAGYHDVKSAGAGAGFQIAPINFGNARRMLGLSEHRPKKRAGGRRRIRQSDEPAAAMRHDPPAGRRGRKKKLDLGNLSNLVTELQDVIAERDRLLQALDEIAAIVRKL